MASSDLSRSLVDAAAEAVYAADDHEYNDYQSVIESPFPAGKPYLENDPRYEEMAARAVAAVLETLAAHCDPVPAGEGSTSQALLSNTELRRLAVEVRDAK